MRKQVGIALIVLGVLMGAVGTAGFSAAEADRGVEIAVVDDDQAYVGYEAASVNATDGEEVTLVEVINRLPTTIDVTEATVGQTSESLTVDIVQEPTGVGTGESNAITAEIGCTERVEDESVSVGVTAEGESVSATLSGEPAHRNILVSCSPESS